MSPECSGDVLGRILASPVDDEVMRVLRAREQRYVLYYLLDNDQVPLERLADVLSGWMAATGHRVTTTVDRESLRIALYHNHLPRLDAAGLVEFDPERRTVCRSPLTDPERDLVEAAYLAEHWTGESTES